MSKVVFIKQNSPEIRRKLEDAGYSICLCAEFEDAVWLCLYPNEDIPFPFDIHGVGPTNDCLEGLPPIERIQKWLEQDDWFPKDREFYDNVDSFLEQYPKPKEKWYEVQDR